MDKNNKITTMKDLIRQIEVWRKKDVTSSWEEGFNDGLDCAIEILQSHPVIHCKALRDKNTKEWYDWESPFWNKCKRPSPIRPDIQIEDLKFLPPDCELIDLTIIVGEGEG